MLTMTSMLKDYRFTWKDRIAIKRDNYKSSLASEIVNYFASAKNQDVVRGEIGLWVSPVVNRVSSVKDDSAKDSSAIWPMFDVEASGKDITASIEVAKQFYFLLAENRLVHPEMKMLLTGNGFRFVMPFLLGSKYKAAFSHWLSQYDGVLIDAKPSTKDLPIRLFMYRSRLQEGTRKNFGRHVHQLGQHSELFSLTVEQYIALTSGEANHSEMLKWIRDIWPTETCPIFWLAFMEEIERGRKLKSTIIDLPSPVSKVSRAYGVNWPMIEDYLKSLGQNPRGAYVGDTEIVKLQQCPSCGRQDGNPWIWPSGVLACFRSTCEANHCSGGLVPWRWVPDYRGVEVEDSHEPIATVTINEARSRMLEAVQGESDLVLAVTPGAGKTTTTLKALVPQLKDKLCLWACPTKELGREAESLAREIGGFNVAFIEGRTLENCKYFGKVQSALAKGLSPALKVCAGCSSKRGVYQCDYYRQMDDLPAKGLIVTSHAKSLYLEYAVSPDIFVLDEDCLGTFFRKDRISLGDMDNFVTRLQGAHSGFASAWEKIERVRREVASKVKPKQYGRLYATEVPEHTQRWESHSLKELAGLTENEVNAIAHAIAVYEPLNDETAFGWQQRLDQEGVNPKCINWFRAFFGESSETAYISIRAERGKGSEYVAYRKTRPFPRARLILIDGTANPEALRQMFRRDFEVVEARVTIQGCKLVHIKRWLSKTGINQWKDLEKELKSGLKRCIDHLEREDQKVLVYTHKTLLDGGMLPRIVKLIDPHRHYEFANYYASRGVNRFEDFDAVIAFGTPAMDGIEALDQGMEFFGEESEQDRWGEYLRQAELCQAVHRVRPVKGSKTIIVASTYWPDDLGRPDTLIVADRKEETKKGRMHEAIRRASQWIYEHGVFTKEMALFCGIVALGQEEQWKVIENNHDKVPTHIIECFNGLIPKPPIFFQRRNDWGDFLDLLLQEFPRLPRLSIATSFTRGGPMSGIGAAENFYGIYSSIEKEIDNVSVQESFKPVFYYHGYCDDGEFEFELDSYYADPSSESDNWRNLKGEYKKRGDGE